MTNSAKSCEQLFGRERNLPRRCEHGARNEETYFEIIDGLNKEKPMPELTSGFAQLRTAVFAPAPETDGC